MIKRILLYIASVLLALSAVSPISAQTTVKVNPLNVALLLVEELDTASMSKTSRYYGLIEIPSKDKYKVYQSPDGTEIRFMFNSEGPIIEVSTNQKINQIEKRLKDNGFSQPNKSVMIFEDTRRQVKIDRKTSTVHIKKKPFKRYDK